MPDNPHLMDEKDIPANWIPVPERGPLGAPAPPARNDMPQFFSGSMPPALQHDKFFVGTQVGTPGIPTHSLMPFGNQASAFTNAAAQSTASTTPSVTPTPPPFDDVEELCHNLQTGTSYTLQAADRGNLITFNNNAGGTIQIPQTAGGSTTSSFGTPVFYGTGGLFTNLSISSINIPAQSLIVVCLSWSDAGTASVSDDAGNSYAATALHHYTFDFMQYFYVLSASGNPSATITSTFTFSNNFNGMGIWIVPLNGTVLFDFVNYVPTTNSPTIVGQTSAPFTTASNDELVFAMNSDSGVGNDGGSPNPDNTPVSWTSGWTVDSPGFGQSIPTPLRKFFSSAHIQYTSLQQNATVTTIVGYRQASGGLPVIGFKGATISPVVTGINKCWYTYIQNSGTGSFTLTLPSFGGATLDGSTSNLTIPASSGIILEFDGFNWYTERGMGGALAGLINTAQAVVDFGNLQSTVTFLEDTTASVTVAAPWVTASTVFAASPTDGQDHPTADEAAAEGITFSVGNIVVGVSFDVIAQAPNGSWGKYVIDVIGIG
jgi:hypothetical protein